MTDYLAYMAWFSVTGETALGVVKDDLEHWFKELELEDRFLPRPVKAIDAFKLATAGKSEVYTGGDGLRYQLTIATHKTTDPDLVQRHVMRIGISHEARSVRVATITFYRPRRRAAGRVPGSEDVKSRLHAGLEGIDLAMVRQLVDGCLEGYRRSLSGLTPPKIRGVLRDYLSYVGAVRQPGEGVYFVPLDGYEEVKRLREVVARCGERCSMTLVPLVDGPEYRGLLQESIDVDVDTRGRRTLQDIDEWQGTHPGQVPGRLTVHAWMDELQGLREQVLEFAGKYGMTFERAADRLEELAAAVEPLARRYLSGV